MGRSGTSGSQSGALYLVLILGLLAGSLVIGPIESAPVKREAGESSGAIDPVWRMVAGAKTSTPYMFYKQVTVFKEEPLVAVNRSNSSSELLQSLLEGVCELLSVYDLISRVVDTNSSDLYLLLTQNIVDSCVWLNHLVSNTGSVIASDQLLQLNDTCTPESPMPRLRHYCLQMRVGDPDQLRHVMQRTLNDGLSTYYPTPLVTKEDQCRWLEGSQAITGGLRNTIETMANLSCHH